MTSKVPSRGATINVDDYKVVYTVPVSFASQNFCFRPSLPVYIRLTGSRLRKGEIRDDGESPVKEKRASERWFWSNSSLTRLVVLLMCTVQVCEHGIVLFQCTSHQML